MSPLLIDNRGLIKFGFISLLATVLIFAAGFLTGFQRANAIYQSGNEITTLSLPVKVAVAEVDIEPRVPEIIEAGEDVDVDKPAVKTETILKTAAKVNGPTVPEGPLNTANDEDELTIKNTSTGVNKKTINSGYDAVISVAEKAVVIDEPDTEISPAVRQSRSESGNAFSVDELGKIKYSIQVGMYGRLMNAENMMNQLQAKKLNAYVSDYTNKKNETRYNVRFGYFLDKKSALSALEEYRSSLNGEGYLVKFSVEDIVNIAITEDMKRPALNKGTDEKLSPVILPPDAIQEKVSRAEVLNVPKKQPEIVTN